MCKKPVFLVVVMFTLSGAMACMAQDPDPAMLGWWKLDDGAGDIAADSSGRANHGTITNLSGGLGTDGNVWVQDLERGTVLSFDGSASGAYVRACPRRRDPPDDTGQRLHLGLLGLSGSRQHNAERYHSWQSP